VPSSWRSTCRSGRTSGKKRLGAPGRRHVGRSGIHRCQGHSGGVLLSKFVRASSVTSLLTPRSPGSFAAPSRDERAQRGNLLGVAAGDTHGRVEGELADGLAVAAGLAVGTGAAGRCAGTGSAAVAGGAAGAGITG